MCFSAEADIVAGIGVVAMGVDTFRHVRQRREVLLATLPLLLGVHQLIEVFVWWDLQGHASDEIGRVALWMYLLIAFVVLPVYVPLAVLLIEPTRQRRWRMVPFVALGVLVSTVLFAAMIRGPMSVSLHPWHLAYRIQLSHGGLVVVLYIVAVCGALLFSAYRHVVLFGLVNIGAVAILAVLTMDGFASLWCVYAAIAAGAIAFHLRFAKAHRAMPYVLT